MPLKILLLYAYFIFQIAIIIWIYNDAETHNNTGLLWVLLVFIFQFPAVVVYLVLFRGASIGPARQHKAIGRNEDFNIRAKYTANYKKGRGTTGDTGGTMAGTAPAVIDFSDITLDRLLDDVKLSYARVYLEDILQIAKDMNDEDGLKNYSSYQTKIASAQKRGVKKTRFKTADSDSYTRF
jgi:hypothetical protein